jgi:hypothetical protein
VSVDVLGRSNHGIAEWETTLLNTSLKLNVGKVKLHFAVKYRDHRIQKAAVPNREFLKARKHFRIEAGDPVQDGGFDVIHLRPIRDSELVLLGRPLSELLEGPQDLCAEIRCVAISPDGHSLAVDVEGISDRLEICS